MFQPANQMRQQLWEEAEKDAERALPKKLPLTPEIEQRVEDGKKVAMLMTQDGWDVVEAILIEELELGNLIKEARNNEPNLVSTYRVGIVTGILQKIYMLPQFAEKAAPLLRENAKRSGDDGRRSQRDKRAGRRIFFGRGGEREAG